MVSTRNTFEDSTKTSINILQRTPLNAKYYRYDDTVFVISSLGDSLLYLKDEFNDIVDSFPELTSEFTKNPDTAYTLKMWADLTDRLGNRKHLTFGSEVGQDRYYVLYAYFLKEKNGIEEYNFRREKLLRIYRTLNSLFSELTYGGTYFGHQYSRIDGYAEYSIYLYKSDKSRFDKVYDIAKKKQHYISGLRNLITKEVQVDSYLNNEIERSKRRKELFLFVDKLNTDLTDNFYLQMAQSFQGEHYSYDVE